jgi:hypothetical protein
MCDILQDHVHYFACQRQTPPLACLFTAYSITAMWLGWAALSMSCLAACAIYLLYMHMVATK